MRITDRHTFFFTARDAFSNWHAAPFTLQGHQFNCVEQAMMWGKATIFGDDRTAAKILANPDPKAQKALGRQVHPYDDAIWSQRRARVVYAACHAKFTQNPHLLRALMDTGDTTLVEASPYDRLWGIGMDQNAPGVEDPANWRGQNLLGQVLTRLRDNLRHDLDQTSKPAHSRP